MKEKVISILNFIKIPLLFILATSFSLVVLMTTLSVIRPFDDVDVKHDDLMHDYVKTTVVEKRYEEGYGNFWWYKEPVYYIISIDDNQETWTTYVDVTTFGQTKIGDSLAICKNHNKLKEFEK